MNAGWMEECWQKKTCCSQNMTFLRENAASAAAYAFAYIVAAHWGIFYWCGFYKIGPNITPIFQTLNTWIISSGWSHWKSDNFSPAWSRPNWGNPSLSGELASARRWQEQRGGQLSVRSGWQGSGAGQVKFLPVFWQNLTPNRQVPIL